MTAACKGAFFLSQDYGDAALRQIVWDNLLKARDRRDAARVAALGVLFLDACERHPGTCDRRRAHGRPAHPHL